MTENQDFYELYPELTTELNKLGAESHRAFTIFLHCLHFAWDDSMQPSDVLKPVMDLLEDELEKDNINDLLQLIQLYNNSCISWFSQLNELEDFDFDRHVDKMYEFFKNKLGNQFASILKQKVEIELNNMLAVADLKIPENYKENEVFLQRMNKSRLECSSEIILNMLISLEKLSESESEGRCVDLFEQYVIACQFLNEYRLDIFHFLDKYKKIGRNNPCPCQSGRKWKQCHGRS